MIHLLIILVSVLFPPVYGDLKLGFYEPICPQAETLVRSIVQQHFATDKSITAALLRMQFHDCFVRGCDASILIDSTAKTLAEKDAAPNLTVRGYELIDKIKQSLEVSCPQTVSCSDIITLATRDAVTLSGGPSFPVLTGRRDGTVSLADEVDLPGPSASVSRVFQLFQSKGLTITDMVALFGAHTVGVSHCSFFEDRIDAFSPDPSMDPILGARLRNTCGSTQALDPTVFLDQNTSFVVDNEFYKQLVLKRGVLKIDQELAVDGSTAGIVSSFARNGGSFMQTFASAMVKMGSIEVLTGKDGQVRANCRVFNKNDAVVIPHVPPTPLGPVIVPRVPPPPKGPVIVPKPPVNPSAPNLPRAPPVKSSGSGPKSPPVKSPVIIPTKPSRRRRSRGRRIHRHVRRSQKHSGVRN